MSRGAGKRHSVPNASQYNDKMKTILTITGSDSTGESGIQADINTMTSLGVKAVSVVTSVTIQNTIGIQDFYDLPSDVVSGQLDAIINDVEPEVVKIGMIREAEQLKVIVSPPLSSVGRRLRPHTLLQPWRPPHGYGCH